MAVPVLVTGKSTRMLRSKNKAALVVATSITREQSAATIRKKNIEKETIGGQFREHHHTGREQSAARRVCSRGRHLFPFDAMQIAMQPRGGISQLPPDPQQEADRAANHQCTKRRRHRQ